MFIRSLAVEGLASLPLFEVNGLQRAVRVCGDSAACTALANALSVALSVFSVDDTRRAAAHLGLGKSVTVTGQGIPEEIHVEHPAIASQILAVPRGEEPPSIKVSVELELDPPQFGELRRYAQRDPRLVPALAEQGALVRVSVGWAFTTDFTLAIPSILSVRVGGLDLPPEGKESPAWLRMFLSGFRGRCHRRGPLEFDAAALARDGRHPEPARRAGAAAMVQTLKGSPFRMGVLELVDPDVGGIFAAISQDDGNLVPLRALGPEVVDAAGLIQAVHAHPAEILLLEAPMAFAAKSRARLNWLHAQAEADGSPLEQIWLFGVEGADALELPPVQASTEPA